MQRSRIKRGLFAAAAVVLVLLLLELALFITGYQGEPTFVQASKDIRFSVAGELYGEFDPHRFWRLPNVEPRFSQDNPKIICMADSVTVMYKGKGYPDLLAFALAVAGHENPVEVFNAGVPEYSTYQGRVYLERELIAQKPDIVTIQYGWNDHWNARLGVPDHEVSFPTEGQKAISQKLYSWRTYRLLRTTLLSGRFSLRVPLDQYTGNLTRMIELAKSSGAKVILIAPVYLAKNQDWIPVHNKYMAATENAAKKTGSIYIDLQDVFENDPALFIEPEVDQVHFNWQGAKVISDAIVKVIIEKGLLQ